MSDRVALDTNRITDFFRGDERLSEQLEWCQEVWIPLTVLGELEAGFQSGGHVHRNRRQLQALLHRPSFAVLLPDELTAGHYGQLFAQLRRTGQALPDNDLWIAALCVQHNLALITRDKHFDRVPQLLRA